MTSAQEGTIRSRDGLRLFYRDYPGNAARVPVLCLAGLTRNSGDFLSLAERLSPSRRVITPDQRGRGRSEFDPLWMRYNPAVYVDDMLALLNALRIKRVVVIGTSLGGIISMLIAAMHPQVLTGVVLNDVGPELAGPGVARVRDYVGTLPPVRTWEEATAQMRSTYGRALPGLSPEEWLAFTRACYSEDAQGVPRLQMDPRVGDAVRMMPSNAAFAMWMAFAALRRIPTLLLRGAHSDVLSPATVANMRREKPDLRYVEVPNRGHAPLLNEPESVAAIDDFLAQLP
ncbi:MAG: alpha/beta hydrolase [Steroidobacteraceae bacterium]